MGRSIRNKPKSAGSGVSTAQLAAKADAVTVSTLTTTVDAKASQADLTTLEATVDAKASQADLTTLEATVSGHTTSISDNASAIASKTLGSLTDVSVSGPSGGQALLYDAASQAWLAGDVAPAAEYFKLNPFTADYSVFSGGVIPISNSTGTSDAASTYTTMGIYKYGLSINTSNSPTSAIQLPSNSRWLVFFDLPVKGNISYRRHWNEIYRSSSATGSYSLHASTGYNSFYDFTSTTDYFSRGGTTLIDVGTSRYIRIYSRSEKTTSSTFFGYSASMQYASASGKGGIFFLRLK